MYHKTCVGGGESTRQLVENNFRFRRHSRSETIHLFPAGLLPILFDLTKRLSTSILNWHMIIRWSTKYQFRLGRFILILFFSNRFITNSDLGSILACRLGYHGQQYEMNLGFIIGKFRWPVVCQVDDLTGALVACRCRAVSCVSGSNVCEIVSSVVRKPGGRDACQEGQGLQSCMRASAMPGKNRTNLEWTWASEGSKP